MLTSVYQVADKEVAEQLCRAALGAGLQARRRPNAATPEVSVDHLESEREKLDQLVHSLDPQANRIHINDHD
jgi:hypothetical protein